MNCLSCNQPVASLHEQDCPRAGLFRKRVTDDDTVERIRPEIQALIRRGNVTLAEIQEIRCNSWEWEALVPAFDDAAFVDRMQYALDNCAQGKSRPFTVYDDAVKGLYAPELLKRFQRAAQGANAFAEEPQAALRDKDGTFLCFSCRKSPAVGMSCGGPICTSCAYDLPFTSFPLNGLLCPVCRLPQRNTSGGASCENGHGGEIGVEP